MLNYDPRSPLIFIHVPKTAGQTVKSIAKAWFGREFYPHYFDESAGGLPPKRDFGALSHGGEACIYGHFNRLRGFGIEDYYPEAKQFVSILRDPLEMAISSYFYTRTRTAVWKDQSRIPQGDLESYLTDTPLNMLNHFPRLVTPDNYKEIIEKYFIYIGNTENLLSSLQALATKLRKPLPNELPIVNATTRAEYEISTDVVTRFKEKNKLEYLVYQYALECR